MKAFVFLALLCNVYAATDFYLQCTPKPDRGSCNLSLQRWWYNTDSEQCEVFDYGGCGGNENVYKTKELCEVTCMGKKTTGAAQETSEEVTEVSTGPRHTVCLRPPHRGPCLGNLERFYYDHQEKTCKTFVYGGCDSNLNNFETHAHCTEFCQGRLLP